MECPLEEVAGEQAFGEAARSLSEPKRPDVRLRGHRNATGLRRMSLIRTRNRRIGAQIFEQSAGSRAFHARLIGEDHDLDAIPEP